MSRILQGQDKGSSNGSDCFPIQAAQLTALSHFNPVYPGAQIHLDNKKFKNQPSQQFTDVCLQYPNLTSTRIRRSCMFLHCGNKDRACPLEHLLSSGPHFFHQAFLLGPRRYPGLLALPECPVCIHESQHKIV